MLHSWILIFSLLVLCVLSLKVPTPIKTLPSARSWLIDSSSDLKTLLPATVLIPSVASATDGAQSAVLIPIVISILTIVPFLYYQQ